MATLRVSAASDRPQPAPSASSPTLHGENSPTLPTSEQRDPLQRLARVLGYQVISIRTAAHFAGVSVAHMHRAAKGELPNTAQLKVFRVGRRVLTRTDWLDEWMRAGPASSPADGEPQRVVA
jgi:hypothetical protein